MSLIHILSPERMLCAVELTSKRAVLEKLSQILSRHISDVRKEDIYQYLWDREQLGVTSLGHGIALPHARIPNIDNAIGAFLQLKTPIDFDAPDEYPVDLVCALLVPDNDDTDHQEHLKVLSELAAVFIEADMPDKLRAAVDEQQLFSLIIRQAE